MTTWSHLPNAAHIDAVLEDARVRPEAWVAAGVKARDDLCEVRQSTVRHSILYAARDAAWNAARDAAITAARYAEWLATRDEAWGIARSKAEITARDVMRALIAWDESAALLDLTPDALRTIISTHDGDVKHQAVLLLPAVIVRSTV